MRSVRFEKNRGTPYFSSTVSIIPSYLAAPRVMTAKSRHLAPPPDFFQDVLRDRLAFGEEVGTGNDAQALGSSVINRRR